MTEEEKQVYQTMVNDSHKYIYNIMELGNEYNEDEFQSKVKRTPDIFTDFSEVDKNINITTLIHGYGNFGRAFIDKVSEKDVPSLLNMFEAITQEYLDLHAAIESQFEEFQKQMETKETVAKAVENTNEN